MKASLIVLLQETIALLQQQELLPETLNISINVEHCKDKQHGDLATNLAMVLAKPAKRNPRELAELIRTHLPTNQLIESVDIAGPGFINFRLIKGTVQGIISTVLEKGAQFGYSNQGNQQKILIEYVSANPTGPLHVGHGRGAAYGSSLSNLLAISGYQVTKEYYVNDAGRQMDILATSVWLRYLELCDGQFEFPSNGYRGDYIRDIAQQLFDAHQTKFSQQVEQLFKDVPADEPQGGDKEAHIDGLINNCKTLLGPANYRTVFDYGLNSILSDIKEDLSEFGVPYDNWFSERSLSEDDLVDSCLERLQKNGILYKKEGATWFKSTQFGDDKDRVVVRENGQSTYFASDIAYHLNKFERGFDQVINIWGSDHHGYIARVKASIEALELDSSKLEVLLVQFANLYRGGEKIQMSTRSGQFVTLRELRDEIGSDAARYFYVMRKTDQHMDFDLDLAKSQSQDNPLYYAQYAHARVCSVLRQLKEKSISWDQQEGEDNLELLVEPHEEALISWLTRYPEVTAKAAADREPHQLVNFLKEIAASFHSYYNAHTFLVEDSKLRNARLNLIIAARQVLQNSLSIIGVSAPEKM